MIKIKEIWFQKEIEPDVFYIYPSRNQSGAFVMKGKHLYDWLNNQLSDFELVSQSYLKTFRTLSKIFKPDYLNKTFDRWNERTNIDDLAIIAYHLHGDTIKRISPGSGLHAALYRIVSD